MTEETKQKLRAAGRQDLIDVHELNQSGYAGVNRQGMIVDRRTNPDAVPVQKNDLFGIPEPKKVTKLVQCVACMHVDYFEDRHKVKSGGVTKYLCPACKEESYTEVIY